MNNFRRKAVFNFSRNITRTFVSNTDTIRSLRIEAKIDYTPWRISTSSPTAGTSTSRTISANLNFPTRNLAAIIAPTNRELDASVSGVVESRDKLYFTNPRALYDTATMRAFLLQTDRVGVYDSGRFLDDKDYKHAILFILRGVTTNRGVNITDIYGLCRLFSNTSDALGTDTSLDSIDTEVANSVRLSLYVY